MYVAYHVPAQTAKKNLESPRYRHISFSFFRLSNTYSNLHMENIQEVHIHIYCTLYIR